MDRTAFLPSLRRAAAAAAGALVLAAATPAQAVPVFSDNFDANALGLNSTPTGWTSLFGTVDVIGPGLFDLLPGNGHYLDLDGSTNQGGWLLQTVNLTGGVTYALSFDLAGSQRGDSNVVDVTFGNIAASYVMASADSFGTRTLLMTPNASGTFFFSFRNQGGDNVGALLDRVSVSAVPEPQALSLMLAGLGLIGWTLRRRRGG